MIQLEHYGWTMFFHQQLTPNDAELRRGRVISIKGLKYFLITDEGETDAELAGRLLFETDPDELPRPGDWVMYKHYDQGPGYIVTVLKRRNALARKASGTGTWKQILAANIDCALVVQGLDGNWNLNRLDRYLVQLAACGIPAVVVLNKADLITDRGYFMREIAKLKRDCQVYFCSTYTGDGMAALRDELLQPCQTYILLGSSGVGKSSILNYLMEADVQTTQRISHTTSKGLHTTTTRDLFRLPNHSLLIDSPGMREFGLAFHEADVSGDLFPAISRHASHCRFNDCQHIDETGCAVLAALKSGELDPEAYESYVKLIREQRRFEVSADEKKRMNKRFGRMSREAKSYRKKYKY
jgi:ribosome biogenesis GTPase / thiamine phosphate phosphatase